MDLDAKLVVEHIRSRMRAHFRKREGVPAANLATKWRQERVYPYKRGESSPVENVEREVFDICAMQIHEYMDGFDTWTIKNKQLTFRLIKEALKSSPSSLRSILSEVLTLPAEEQDTLEEDSFEQT